MNDLVGRPAKLLHVMVLLAVAAPGIGVLLLLAVVVAADPQSIAVLGLIFAAPIWLAGIAAAYELVRILRGGRVTFQRALTWAIGVIVVGAVLGYFTGFLRSGMTSLASLDPAAWLILIWIVLGLASLAGLVASRRKATSAPA